MIRMTGASIAALTLALGVSGSMAQSTTGQQRGLTGAPSPTTEAPKVPITGQIVAQDANTILAKELIGQTVYAPDHAKVGSISDLILSKDGKNVEGYVIGVGGFLGLGEKTVALKMDQLQMTPNSEGDGLMLMMGANKVELRNTPPFKSKKELDAEKQAVERAQNGPEVPRAPQPGNTIPQPSTK